MSNEFLKSIQNITDPEIEEKINSKDPYTICDVLEETKGGPNGIYLKQLEDAIIATNDIVQIYEFMFLAVDMNIIGFNREKFEEIIRQSNNPKLMCYCMGFVPGTNIRLMLNALIQTQNAKYMEMLITNEEYSEVLEQIEQIMPNYKDIVEEAKSYDYYPYSLEEYKDLKENILDLKEKVKESKNPHLITELANYIEYLNEYKEGLYEVEDLAIEQEKLKDPMQAYEFLASVNVKDKSGLVQTVINSGKVKFMYYVYKYVENLTEDLKFLLEESIKEIDKKGKYRKMIEEEAIEENQQDI